MFKIGDFSKISQTPISQLRYYDEIGLFKPEEVDPFTGYRYYSATQLPRLNRILVLRELGLTLEQVSQSLDENISAEEVRGMLRLRKATLEQSVQEELGRLRAVEARLRLIESEGADRSPEVVMKSIPRQTFLSLRQVLPHMTDAFPVVQEMLTVLPERYGPKLGYLTAILHNPEFDFQNVDLEIGFMVEPDMVDSVSLPSERVLETRELPAEESMATVIRLGRPENSCASYFDLGGWLDTHRYQFSGAGREVFLQPPFPGKEDEMVVEIQFPVTRDAAIPLPS